MRVGIDEARQHCAACGVYLLRTARQRMSLNPCAGADSDDKAVGDEHGAVFYESDAGKLVATTGSASAQS
jgi:hypothetical protein